MLHQATAELESRRKRARLIEGGLTINGAAVRTGEILDVMRRYQCSRGTWCLALGINGRVRLPMVAEEKVEYLN